MSTRLVRLDDLTGEVLNEGAPVRFSLGESEYEIDLTSENRRRLLDLLAPYIDAARRASYRTTALPKAGPKKRR